EATDLVGTWKVAVFAPAATVTLDGGVAAGLLDDSATTIPPVAAFPLRVTVPVAFAPPMTEVGATDKLETVGGVTVRVPETSGLLPVAEIVAVVFFATGAVMIVNVADVAASATETFAGGIAQALSEESATDCP